MKLTANNAGDLELSTHRRAVTTASAALAGPLPSSSSEPSPSPLRALPESSPPPQTNTDDALSVATDSFQMGRSSKQPSQAIASSPSVDSIIIVSPTTSDDLSCAHKVKKKKTSAASGDQELSRGLSSVSIIDIDDIDNPLDKRLNKSNPTADNKEFFFAGPSYAWSTQKAHEVQSLRIRRFFIINQLI